MSRPRTPEGQVKASVLEYVKYLRASGRRIRLWAIVGGPLQPPGIADYLGVDEGRPLAVECKAPKGKQNPAQKVFQAAWEDCGGTYALCYGPDDLERALKLKEMFF